MAGLVLVEVLLIGALITLALVFLRLTFRLLGILLFTKGGLMLTGAGVVCVGILSVL